MKIVKKRVSNGDLVLEQCDYTPIEWRTICVVFGVNPKKTLKIVIPEKAVKSIVIFEK